MLSRAPRGAAAETAQSADGALAFSPPATCFFYFPRPLLCYNPSRSCRALCFSPRPRDAEQQATTGLADFASHRAKVPAGSAEEAVKGGVDGGYVGSSFYQTKSIHRAFPFKGNAFPFQKQYSSNEEGENEEKEEDDGQRWRRWGRRVCFFWQSYTIATEPSFVCDSVGSTQSKVTSASISGSGVCEELVTSLTVRRD